MSIINVDFGKIIGKIKPMHAVGQPPFKVGFNILDCSPMEILRDAHIPYSRLHDVGGPFGGNRYVDIPNIFRDFDADENDPENYDFAFTDVLITGMIEHNVAPYFRLGVTIENQSNIKAYRIHPPKDFNKWARICEHIVRHYNEGWADGFHYGIVYWEVWNEPENRDVPELNQMWTGTAEQLYELYDITAKHLKNCFGDKIKIGGYASAGLYGIYANPEKYNVNVERRTERRFTEPREEYRVQFFLNFLKYIKEHQSPIDFFSWHIYATYDVAIPILDFANRELERSGYGDIEVHLNEWNHSHDRLKNRDTSFASAQAAAMMSVMQKKKIDMLMYYDAKYVNIGAYACFYNLTTYEPSNVYYAFKAFGQLYAMENEVQSESNTEGLHIVAACQGDKKAALITNTSGIDRMVKTNLGSEFEAYLIDADHLMEKVNIKASEFIVKENQILLFIA